MGVHTSISPEDLAKVALDSKADIVIVDEEIQLKKVTHQIFRQRKSVQLQRP